ncbi:MAG TPA: SDR family NAD(P)-dependent oxidoreductase [Solirubrobacteraceae bacterium]|jgi:short-subunit dehydrogenase|nr:SDR family NAD(P)-dependent oxidoreductase [Solirubrobacteraceae bacterium]
MTTSIPRRLAVVTGASSGIGFELAKQFATHDFDLIVAAEDDELRTAARELEQLGASVDAVQVDLATDDGVDELYRRMTASRRPVDAVALNAGVGAGGAFAGDTDLHDELRIVDLNVRSTVHLAKHVVRDMVERGQGQILLTSSIASTMPGSFQAVYNASKSFVQSFALALRNELQDTGVTVTSLMPGPTDTEFFERAGMLDTVVGAGPKDDPADVARDGFEALMAGRERVVSASAQTKLQGRASRLLPDSAKARVHAVMAKPRSSDASPSSVLAGALRVRRGQAAGVVAVGGLLATGLAARRARR